MAERTQTPAQLEAAIRSGDSRRIWEACSAISSLSQSRADVLALLPLERPLEHLARRRTVGNTSVWIARALAVLRFHRSGEGCPCCLLWERDRPDVRAEEGYVTLLRRGVPNYMGECSCVVRCTRCGAVYAVEPREYHYLWWEWTPLEPGV